jgi:hypothetical protein
MQGTTLFVTTSFVDQFRPNGSRHQNKNIRIISTEVKNADHVTIHKGLPSNIDTVYTYKVKSYKYCL